MKLCRRLLGGHNLEGKFWRFHSSNPHIYAKLVTLAREWKAAGHQTCGIAMLVAKAHLDFGLKGHPALSVSNNYRRFYARLIMAQEPELRGFFRLRVQVRPRTSSARLTTISRVK